MLIQSLQRRSDERGIAMIVVVLLLAVIFAFAVTIAKDALHSNQATTNDYQREAGFQAANAGYDDTLSCLTKLNPAVGTLNDCDITVARALTDNGKGVGTYTTDVTNITPAGGSNTRVLIRSVGTGPTSSGRAQRRIEVELELLPVGGFFYTLFASPGSVVFKNISTVSGPVYANTSDLQQNGNTLGDVHTPGSFIGKNNDTIRSVWAGGDVTLGNGSTVQTTAKACGSNGAGNATINGSVAGQLQYKGALSPGTSCCGSVVRSACAGPTALPLPAFTYSTANYPGWTNVTFTGPTAHSLAGLCLTTRLAINCNGQTIGDTSASYGKAANGVVLHVTKTTTGSCTLPFGGGTITGNFTIISNCKLSLTGTYTKAAVVTGNKQLVFVSTSSTGIDDINISVASANSTISILGYTLGQLSSINGLNLQAASLYGSSFEAKNNMTVGQSTDLNNNPPPGFTFTNVTATRYSPILLVWREIAAT